MHRSPRMPQTQRNRELGLLLFAFLINGAAVALVQLGATGHIDWTFLYYCGGLTVLVLGLHIVLRYRAPQADPFVVPIATVLSGLGLAMIYRIDIEDGDTGWAALSTRQLVWLVIAIGAAVAIVVRGHSVLEAIPASRSSSAMPKAHNVIPNLAIMYGVGRSHFDSSRIGGESVRM